MKSYVEKVMFLVALCMFFVLSSFVMAFADGALWDPIVTAANVSGLSTAQIALLAAVILIPLGFAAYKVIRHALGLVR